MADWRAGAGTCFIVRMRYEAQGTDTKSTVSSAWKDTSLSWQISRVFWGESLLQGGLYCCSLSEQTPTAIVLTRAQLPISASLPPEPVLSS